MLTTRAVPQVLLVVFLALVVSGCSLAGGIFKAGFWSGIILVLVGNTDWGYKYHDMMLVHVVGADNSPDLE